MVTMSDIAKKAGISSATVSRVMNRKDSAIPISKKTRENVLAIAKEMGYRPNLFARSLRTQKSFLVGVVLWDLTDPFFSEILRGIEQVLEQRGYNLLLTTAEGNRERERVCLEKLRNTIVDGILIVGGPKSCCDSEIAELGVDTRGVVLIGTRAESTDLSSVTVDNVSGGFIGAEYLVKLNRSRIIYIAGKEKTIDMEDRLVGVRKAVEKYGFQERLAVVEVGPGEEEGYVATQKILNTTELPLSIFGVNDLTALGIIRAVKDRKLKIPEDVAVLGFDDLSIASFLDPRLSTVHQPRLQMGRSGSELLVQLITRKEKGFAGKRRNKVLTPQLVVRQSA
jgi:DNA-binding LacI/PurR family transcriptional regulator